MDPMMPVSSDTNKQNSYIYIYISGVPNKVTNIFLTVDDPNSLKIFTE